MAASCQKTVPEWLGRVGADEGTIRGLLKVYGLKIGAIHRNRFAARVVELLEMATLPELSAAIEPLLRVREGMCTERKALDRTLAAAARRSDVGTAVPVHARSGRYDGSRFARAQSF
jgi:hypothetical protein